jgi:EpsI family protein
LMFWIGSFWREDMEDTAGQQPLLSVTPAASSRGPVIVAAALAVATAAVWPAAANRLESANEAPVLLKPLVGSGGWRTTEEQLALWSPRFSGARAMVHQTLEKEGVGRVAVYVAYYRDQAVYGELVNSENVLVTTTDKNWREIRKDVQGLSWGSALVQARTSELLGEGQRLLVHRFYWIGGRLTANDYAAKAWLAFTKLAAVGDASAAIVVYTIAAEGQEKQAAVRLDRFAAEVGEEVNRLLLEASGTN